MILSDTDEIGVSEHNFFLSQLSQDLVWADKEAALPYVELMVKFYGQSLHLWVIKRQW